MDLKLAGKTAIVTGSTAGIGLAIAERLAAEGVEVTITGRSQSKLDAAAAQIAKVGKVNPILADPATADGAATLIAAVPEADILVNNLGIYEAKAFTDISDADWHHLFEVNVVSGARLARHYFPKMLAKDWGRVIFISSESSLVIPEEMIHYGTTKTAQLAIARGPLRTSLEAKAVSMADFDKALEETRASVTPEMEREYGLMAARLKQDAMALEPIGFVSPGMFKPRED